jgi:hypothetical protein
VRAELIDHVPTIVFFGLGDRGRAARPQPKRDLPDVAE